MFHSFTVRRKKFKVRSITSSERKLIRVVSCLCVGQTREEYGKGNYGGNLWE